MNITLDAFTQYYQNMDWPDQIENYKFEITSVAVSIVALSALAFFCIQKRSKSLQVEEKDTSISFSFLKDEEKLLPEANKKLKTWIEKRIKGLNDDECYRFTIFEDPFDGHNFLITLFKITELNEDLRQRGITKFRNLTVFQPSPFQEEEET